MGRSKPDGARHARSRPFELLRELVFQERGDVVSVAIFSLAVGLLSLVVPIGAQTIVNNASFATFNQPVVFMLLAVFAGLGLAGVFKIFQTIVVERIQVRLFARSAMRLAERIPLVDAEKLREHHDGGAKLSRWVNRFFDVLTVQKSAAGLLLDGVSVFLQAIIGLVLLAFYHPILLAFDLVLIVGLLFVLFVMGRGLVDTSIHESYRKHDVAGWLEDLADKPILFRTKLGYAFALERSDSLVESYVLSRRAHFRKFVLQVAMFVLIQVFASVVLLGLGSWLVTQNQLTLGQLVAAELVVSSVLASLLKLEKPLENFYDLCAALDKLMSLESLPLEKQTFASIPSQLNGTGPMELEFKDVHQSGADGRWILQGISFRLQPGEHAFITGRKGAGKSTVTNLCYGLMEASRGTISMDREDMRLIPREVLRTHVALVGPIELLPGTLAQNLSLGQPSVDSRELREILVRLRIYDDILAFKDAFETVMSSDGSPFSHVQIRMIVLARAILLRPRLLILDRFFDELDDESLNLAMDEVLRPQSPWTAIVTTARPDLIRTGYRSIHLAAGRVA